MQQHSQHHIPVTLLVSSDVPARLAGPMEGAIRMDAD
jgi:hypothetical protein